MVHGLKLGRVFNSRFGCVLVCVCVRVLVCMCACVWVCLGVFWYVLVCLGVFGCVWVCVYVFGCVSVCVYVYVSEGMCVPFTDVAMKQKCSTKEALLKGRLSTFDLFLLTSLDKLLS